MRPTHMLAIFVLLMVVAIIRIYQILTMEIAIEQTTGASLPGQPPSGGNYRGDGGRIASNMRG